MQWLLFIIFSLGVGVKASLQSLSVDEFRWNAKIKNIKIFFLCYYYINLDILW